MLEPVEPVFFLIEHSLLFEDPVSLRGQFMRGFLDPEGQIVELFLLAAELLNSLLKLLVVFFQKQLLLFKHPLVQ